MARHTTFKCWIGAAQADCDCAWTPGTPSTFDEPGEGPEVDILSVEVNGKDVIKRLKDSTLQNLYDQIYEEYADILDGGYDE